MKDIQMAVITTAFFPKDDVERQLRMFMTSAFKYNIPFIPYGIDEPYCIWADMKIVKKIPVLKALEKMGYTHVLYTDARDAFWTGGLEEIVNKYAAMGRPGFLASTERTCNPNKDLSHHYPQTSPHGYNYHCVGGYIAEIDVAISTFEKMVWYRERSGDDAEIWQWAWAEGWFRPELDRECQIFQTISDGAESHLDITPIWMTRTAGRLYNTATESYPCVFHLNGGYSSAERGKWDVMKPWWDRLHPELRDLRAD